MLTRLFMDTGAQIFFPFLPTIAQGLDVSTIAMGRMVSLRSVTGLLSPIFGVWADSHGYRRIMRIGLLMGAVGYLIIGLSQNLWQLAPGMVLAGLGTFSFVPTLQAYLSMKLPYAQRARGLGILEYAWAMSGIVGLFLVGILIEATSWRIPMFIISGALFIASVLYQSFPATSELRTKSVQKLNFHQVWAFMALGENGRSAWSTILCHGLIMFSAMHLFINYGSWLETDYAFSPASLGRVALILGVADLIGSVIVSIIADRIGKYRSTLFGTILALIGYAALPLLNQTITTVLLGLLLIRFAFEFSLVSNIVLLSEQSPQQRGKMLTLSAAAALLGSTIAGFTGPLAFAEFGVWGLSTIPAVMMFLVIFILIAFVSE